MAQNGQNTENPISNGRKASLSELNVDLEPKQISLFRQALPQFFAVGAKNILLLTLGTSLGYATILIPELQKKDSEIVVTMEELTWISSLNLILVPIGCVVSGPVSQYFGRKRTMMITCFPFGLAWIFFHYASNTTMLFIALALTGLGGGLLEAPVLTYVAEITQPYLRGTLSATSSMTVILGVFTQMLAGSLTTWRTVAMINLIYPIICFLALCLVPESPYWLAAKGRLELSERALCWLRGWTEPANVRTEFHELCKNVTEKASSDSKEKKWKHFSKRTFYVPFLLISFAFFNHAFGGSSTLQTYAVIIFDKLNAPIDKYNATVILGVAELVGTLVCVFLIHFTGRRNLTFFSLVGTGICLVLTAIYGYLNDTNRIKGQDYTWIPTTLLILCAFVSHCGIRLLPWIIIGETFPVQIRSTATGISSSISYIWSFIANKTFFYMVISMSLSGVFLLYGLINFITIVIFYFVLPETEGRTLQEIENHFAGIESLKHKPKRKDMSFKEKYAATNPVPINDELVSKV